MHLLRYHNVKRIHGKLIVKNKLNHFVVQNIQLWWKDVLF